MLHFQQEIGGSRKPLLIQLYNLMHELSQMLGGDGMLDRFLLIAARPVFKKTQYLRTANEKVMEMGMTDFVKVLNFMMEHFKDNARAYQLSEDAQNYYDDIMDNYATIIADRYRSDDSGLEF